MLILPTAAELLEMRDGARAVGAKLSPDGTRAVYATRTDRGWKLRVRTASHEVANRSLADAESGLTPWFHWIDDETLLVHRDRHGTLAHDLLTVDLRTGEVFEPVPSGLDEQLYAVAVDASGFLYLRTGPDERHGTLFRYRRTTGSVGRLDGVGGFQDYYVGADLDPLYASSIDDGGHLIVHALKRVDGGGVRPVHVKSIDFEAVYNSAVLCVEPATRRLLILDGGAGDFARLVAIDECGRETEMYRSIGADVSDVSISPVDGRVDAVATFGDRRRWTALSPAGSERWARLDTVLERRVGPLGSMQVLSRASDDGRWLINVQSDTCPLSTFVFAWREFALERFVTPATSMVFEPSRTERFSFESRDGLDIGGYLTRARAPESGDAASGPAPLILAVHGGPAARDRIGFDVRRQFFSARGFSVANVNFRGSSGFGRTFLAAGNREWGGRMIDDLIDAVRFLTREWLEPGTPVAILGSSYGGFAALNAAMRFPGHFRCAIAHNPPTDLMSLVDGSSPGWNAWQGHIRKSIGDPSIEADRSMLERASPVNLVERATRRDLDLLVFQGENDPAVRESETRRFVERARAAGIGVDYIVYPGEGHAFAQRLNEVDFLERAAAFVRTYCVDSRTSEG